MVRHADAAALNAQLVAANVRVFGLAQQRSTLEEVVLAATGTGSDRVDAR
jgi:ABC-2 type transport system ATP-binding protein